MIKFILVLLALSTVSSILLKKVAHKNDDSCSDDNSHHHGHHHHHHKACAKVVELKKKILANEAALAEFIKKNKAHKDELVKLLAKAKKICAAGHSHSDHGKGKKLKVLLGSSRQLGGDVAAEEDCEEEQAEQSNHDEEESHKNHGNKGNKHNSDDDSKTDKHDNGKHNGKGKSSNAWGQKSITNTKASGNAKGQSFGKGSSQTAAGPQGAHSLANGTKGTKTGSNFKSDSRENIDAWAVNKSNGKSSAWGNKAINEQKVDAKSKAQSFGSGNSGTKTGLDGSQAFGKGTHGTKSGASWDGQADNFGDSWGVSAKKK